MGLSSSTGNRDIFAVVIEDFFFRRISSSRDDSYGDLVLLLQSWRSPSFVHNDPLLVVYPSFPDISNPKKLLGIIISTGYSQDNDFFNI